jgi:sugar phosphate isomerase/epimerase
MYPKWLGTRRIRIYRFLDPRDLFAACPYLALDTSHLTVARENIFDAYRLLAPKLIHIHLSNNADDGRDGHLGLEEGVLPLDRFLREVKGTGYSGAVSLELTVRGYLERPSELVSMLRKNREFIEQQLTPGPLAEDLPKG